MPNLCAVLFLNGPAEMRSFVCDVDRPDVEIMTGCGVRYRYLLRPSLLGAEGWEAVLDPDAPARMPIKLLHERHS